MAPQRFPSAKYGRQLAAMIDDLDTWSRWYQAAAEHTHPEWLQGRFMERSAALTNAMLSLIAARDWLEGLPRLK